MRLVSPGGRTHLCALAFGLGLLACADAHPPRGLPTPAEAARDGGAPAEAGEVPEDEDTHDANGQRDASADLIDDAVRCDDHGAIVDPLILEVEAVVGDPCSFRLRRPRAELQLNRLRVQVNRLTFRPNGTPESGQGSEGYTVAGDVIQFTAAACDLILRQDAGQVLISLRYGVCHNWE
jgi:hypothetical protein